MRCCLMNDKIIYHIFRLKYRCFVYALSMTVPSLYRLYPTSHTLYRMSYIVYPTNFKISKFLKISKKNFKIKKNSKLKKNKKNKKKFKIKKKIQNVHQMHVLSKAWLKYMM